MSSELKREPVTDLLLTPQSSALLVIGQPSQVATATSTAHDLMTRKMVSVARLAKSYGLPIVLSTVNVAANGQPPTMGALSPRSRFARRVLEVDSNLGQGLRHSLNGYWIDAVEEAMPDAGKVNRPRGLQFGHSPRSEPRNVAPCVGGACRLRHEATRLEIVDQTGHPAWRQVGGGGEVGHPQFAIGSFGEVHDRRVLARRQASASDQVAVEMSRDDLDDSHHCAPERFLARRERLDRGHAFEGSLLYQAIVGHLTRTTATARRPDEHPILRTGKARCIA